MRPTPEQRDTLAAEIVMEYDVRVWSSAASLERAAMVLAHCADAGIDASVVTPLQLSAAMNCMPLNAQDIRAYGDMACALAAAMPKVQPQSVNAELLALARQYASECAECAGTGLVTIHTHQGGIDIDAEDQPCRECVDIRKVIDRATGAA